MFIDILLLLVGLASLIYGANLLVDGGSALANRMKVSPLVIGLTVVAFGTSAPELVVNIISSVKGESGIVFGNVLGSNIFNVLCVLGVTALVYPVAIQKTTAKIETPILVLSAMLIVFLFGNNYWNSPKSYEISRLEGIVLLVLFVGYLIYTFRLAKSGQIDDATEIKQISLSKSIILIILGLTGLVLGGHWLVNSAVSIAQAMGIPQRIIAITIVSIGTSMPELVTSIVAATKKKVDIAVGNVIGSCLFNLFAVLGVSAVISPVSLTVDSAVDVMVNFTAALLLFAFVYTGKGIRIDRWEGALLLMLYIAYIVYLIMW